MNRFKADVSLKKNNSKSSKFAATNPKTKSFGGNSKLNKTGFSNAKSGNRIKSI